jgi:16S rRNA (guanine527-N7)-methyltransferase
VRLLVAWNAAINLTSIRDPAEIAIRHVIDSLTAVPLLEVRPAQRIIDIGSGAGFPGLPLAAFLADANVTLVESVGKKARFLETVAAATGIRDVSVAATRVEALSNDARRNGAVATTLTARAVASLADLVELALPLLRPGGALVAWKSASAVDPTAGTNEIAAAERAIAAIDPGAALTVVPAIPSHVVAPVVEPLRGHRLVTVTRTPNQVAAGWPRDPAARRRRPW